MPYGKELIVDLHGCPNLSLDTDLQDFCEVLAELVNMETEDFHYWKSEETDERDPKVFGVSSIQFITTSNITIHALPLLNDGSVYLNLFSCKDFDTDVAVKFVKEWFNAKLCRHTIVERI